MYLLATTTTYQKDTKYYTESSGTYTLLSEGTDYYIGDTITGTIYELAKYDMFYIRDWGATTPYKRFPYKIDGVNTIPEHDTNANDLDLDAFTNTQGKLVRNRVRHDVASVDFKISTMTGEELHELFDMTSDVWLDCLFFYESDWNFVSKKMYRSGTVKFHKYLIDTEDMDKSIYTNVDFGFVEE